MLSAVSVVVGTSNHMGSRINLAEDRLEYEFSQLEKPLDDLIVKSIETVIAEGRNGFKLLWDVLKLQLLAGFILVVVGVIFYPRRKCEKNA